ncbi:glyoxalase superfamily protein [Neobacillus mesonae]|nr:glyoxalase superfamily protein [Neobacillus mesonae]
MMQVSPILRMFDVPLTKLFYIEYLNFVLDFEHQFGENFPMYMQVSKNNVIIHLSEHHGDSTPGSAIRIQVTGLKEYHQLLGSKDYRYAKPGIERTPWNTIEMLITDPSGNRLLFFEPE